MKKLGDELAPVVPLLLNARQAAELVGCDESTWNRWVRDGRVPPQIVHASSYGGRRRYSRVQLERWAAGELAPPTGFEPVFPP